jgi:hypothetical protein
MYSPENHFSRAPIKSPMNTFSSLRNFSLATLSVFVLSATATAETVLDNLGPPNFHTATGGDLVGAAIQIGSTPITISTVEFHQYFTGGYVFRPGQTFAIYSRNADGTLGTPLFTDFTLTPNNQTFTTTATANAAYVLQRDTGYWLVLVSPPATFVLWNHTGATTYTSALGVTIPAQRASFYREDGQNNYFDLDEGPQELRVTGFAATPPAPVPNRIASRKSHGAAGTYDIELPLTGAIGVECRSGGPNMEYQIVFSFPTSVTIQSASVTSGIGTVSSVEVSPQTGTQVLVNLTGVTDVQRLAVTLAGVNDGTGTGDVTARVGMLLGDTTGNGIVSASDIGDAKTQSGQPVGNPNFRTDVTANGNINASDMGLVKSRSGATLPAAREGAVAAVK